MNTLFYFCIAGTVITMIWVVFLFFNWEIPKTVFEFRSIRRMLKDSEKDASKKVGRTQPLEYPKSAGRQRPSPSKYTSQPNKQKVNDAIENKAITPAVQFKEDASETALLSQAEAYSATEYLAEKKGLAFTELLSSQDNIDAVKEKGTEYLNKKTNLDFTEFLSNEQQGDAGVYTEYLQEESQGAVTELLEPDETGEGESAAERASSGYTQILTEITKIEKEGIKKT